MGMLYGGQVLASRMRAKQNKYVKDGFLLDLNKRDVLN